MSKLTALLILLLFVSRAGAGGNDNNSGDIMSLNYYPHAGFFAFTPKINTTVHDFTTSSDNSHDTLYSNTFTAALAYGLGKGWRVALSESLLWDQNQDTIGPLGAESEDSSRGLSNPTVSTAWRFLEDNRNGFSGDLGIAFMPSFGAKVVANGAVSREGNNLTGAAELDAIGSLFWRCHHNELGFVYTFTHEYAGGSEAAAASIHMEGYNAQSFTLKDRIHLNKKFFVEPSAGLTLNHNDNQTRTPGAESTTATPTYINPGFELGFLPDPGLSITIGATQHRGTTTVYNDMTGAAVSGKNNYIMSTVTVLHQF